MATSKESKRNNGKGFGAMDEQRQREIASRGGRASALSNTSNRGFASMDKDKQREISSQGGRASQASGKGQRGSTGRNEQKPSAQSDAAKRDFNSPKKEEDIVRKEREQASYSETDEDENEGVGDGNLGRTTKSPGSDEEG